MMKRDTERRGGDGKMRIHWRYGEREREREREYKGEKHKRE